MKKNNNTPSKAKLIRMALWIVITDPIKRRLGMFDSRGLKYSTGHLAKIKREIAFYPVRKQARYVDRFTKENINQPDFMKKSWLGLNVDDPKHYRTMNATAIGNIAFMFLHGSDRYKHKCKAMLDKYRDYVKSTGSTKVHSINKK
jgi:hypothetical protein